MATIVPIAKTTKTRFDEPSRIYDVGGREMEACTRQSLDQDTLL